MGIEDGAGRDGWQPFGWVDEVRQWPGGDDLYRGGDDRGSSLGRSVEQARQDRDAGEAGGRYGEPGPWIDARKWHDSIERTVRSARTPTTRREFLDRVVAARDSRDRGGRWTWPRNEPYGFEVGPNRLVAVTGDRLVIRTGSVVVGDGRLSLAVEPVPEPDCVRCGKPVPWRHVRPDIGVDVGTSVLGAVAYAYRDSAAIHPRCRRAAERRVARDTLGAVPVVVRGLVEQVGPPVGHIVTGVVSAVAPVITSPVRDVRAAVEHGSWIAAERFRAAVEAAAPVVRRFARNTRRG